MGMLDGLQGVFNNAFGFIFLDGTIYVANRTQGAGGKFSTAFGGPVDCKICPTDVTKAMRDADGYSEVDVGLIILQGSTLAPVLTGDDEVTMRGTRYRVRAPITEDPARATWIFRASPK